MIDLPKPTGPNPKPDWIVIDFEASSLNDGSYPIEFGYCDLEMNSGGFLIRPELEWTDWHPDAASAHGIPRELLFAIGIPAREAAERINCMADGGKSFLCDGGSSDQRWYETLFRATDVIPEIITLRDFDLRLNAAASLHKDLGNELGDLDVLCEMRDQGILRSPHRAEPDARVLAAFARGYLDADYFQALIVADQEFRSRQPSQEDIDKNEIAREIYATFAQSGLSPNDLMEITGMTMKEVGDLLDRRVQHMQIDDLNRIWVEILAAPTPGTKP
ncbi:hypothetical protein [Roseibium aggregatum]|jgi:hypothetical protein|uniref:Exonuclease domain-containing protein n=1 Tax=Roseibium aggregatum TaxID=187304 RepID=A0A0M6YD58_9HYPH|nr:hypothetical protein [Roseibium aggregatum]CTQ47349.1 hypothetical protein LAL4801_05811 [Roseibium aggregatum]